MTLKHLIKLAVIGGALALIALYLRDPYRTRLPFGTDDLSSIQESLDRLPPADRALAEGYVKRSHGDVLPAFMADPDDPLTARTVGEAIELQRRFLERQAQNEAIAREKRAARDKPYEPLRAALSLQLLKREILPREEVLYSPGMLAQLRKSASGRAIDDTPIQMTTYRLSNLSPKPIASAQGGVLIWRLHRRQNELNILDECSFNEITRGQPLEPGESVELRCGNTHRQASAENREYIAMPEEELEIEWHPNFIRFADGTELKYYYKEE